MERTIKGKEVIAYKGMESNMSCRDFQYEIGKTYKTDKAELCECGFHACLNPRDVFAYYSKKTKSRYFKVSLSGEITKCAIEDTKVAATEITILEEITDIFDEVIKTTEWWKNENVLDLLPWSEGFAKVQRGDELWNFIDKQGIILSGEWFDWLGSFYEGFAKIQRGDGLYNFINKKGNYLSNEWFNYLGDFNEGFASVQRGNNLWNFIDRQGNYLSNEWFNYVFYFNKGLAKVQKTNNCWCEIDTSGKVVNNVYIS